MINQWLQAQMTRYHRDCDAIRYARIMALRYDPKLTRLRSLPRRKKTTTSRRMQTIYKVLTND